MATEAETSPALPPRSPSPTPSQCDGEYWDPPCKICKKVDNEDNVLCELCNGAYHLACIEGNYSKGLPRVPTDDEWFCKGCVKRGIPETIIDRVGRGSSAHYLVKWFGRDSSEVSWEDATTLDTAWSLFRSFPKELLKKIPKKTLAAHYARKAQDGAAEEKTS